MPQVIFYPVGNGDTSQIILENGKRILFDYRHIKETEDSKNNRSEINLKERLRKELNDANKTSFEVVAFTHADKDHIAYSTEFFELKYANKYQGDGRIKIDELWVPAAMILEEATNEQQSDEFVIWRQEARHRLKEGSGIRVFSKPEKLEKWLKDNGCTLESRRHLICDAGTLVATFNLDADGVEFFCHSPFIKHSSEGDKLRNSASLIFNVRFKAGNNIFDYLAVGDSEWCILEEIVETTQHHNRMDRLAWDLFNVPHHCSYLALNSTKGDEETTPTPLVEKLLLSGKSNAYIVSSSHAILDTKAAYEQTLPPHTQAKKCYDRYLKEVGGAKFLTTMTYPNADKPEPIIFNVKANGIAIDKAVRSSSISTIITSPAPRAG